MMFLRLTVTSTTPATNCSCLVLTPAPCCSLEVGSPPGSPHCRNGSACVLVRSVVPKMRSNRLFLSRQQVFVRHSDGCANAMEKEELDSRHCLRPHRKGDRSALLRRALGSGRKTTTRLLQTRCRFSRVFWCRNSSSPIARISPRCVSLCRVDWLSLRGTAQPELTILPNLEVLTYPSRCSSGQSSSGESSSARQSLPAWF